MTTAAHIHNVTADGLDVFYREAGPIGAPVILLLHGFPSSSHQFRNLIPLLATIYHVFAPDLPGFGFTDVPESRNYQYTYANLARTVEAFLDAVHIDKFAVYLFDYGAPTALRVALCRPDKITALIAQNGNSYVEGFGTDFWAPIMKYWKPGSQSDWDAFIPYALTFEATKTQYQLGSKRPWTIPPETYNLDWALLSNATDQQHQLDLFYDYRTNVHLYQEFQEYFRTKRVPLLVV